MEKGEFLTINQERKPIQTGRKTTTHQSGTVNQKTEENHSGGGLKGRTWVGYGQRLSGVESGDVNLACYVLKNMLGGKTSQKKKALCWNKCTEDKGRVGGRNG